MIVKVKDKNGEQSLEVPKDESGFYQKIAEKVTALPFPNDVTVTIAGRTIQYTMEERGGTCNIQETFNDIQFKEPGEYPKCYLTYADFVSAEKKAKEERGELKLGGDYGSYKFYSLESEDDRIKASWGSMRGIGKSKSCYYKRSMYWIKYYEKINKGYVDNSEAYVEKEQPEAKVALPKLRLPEKEKHAVNPLAQRLYNLLSNSSIQLIKRSVKSMHVTQGMVNESKKYLNQLYNTVDIEAFNHILLKLCMVCPRKVWDMKDLMAKSAKDINKVLEREEDLVSAMEGLLLKQQSASVDDIKPDEKADPFKEIGIEISAPSKADTEKVYKMLPDELRSKVANVYKVNCPEHAERFEKYCNQNGIDKNHTKFLWHGSRNENWLSIIKLGLLLKPNAQITGKMFGNGIYFAPKAKKSWNYTSYRGAFYTNGSSSFAVMGVYETAYGEPYHPTRGENWNFTQLFLKKSGKNCVHAEGGTCGLINDEIIFYDEGAMCLRYVVEFR